MTAKIRSSPPRSRLGGRFGSAKNAGIATIRHKSENYHAGMGILVDRRHVITCAHVINVALGHDAGSEIYPDNDSFVVVRFPLLANQPEINAKISSWRAPGLVPQNDIALLTLSADAPEEAGIAILADISEIPLDSDRLSVFGQSETGPSGDYWIGNNVDATFMGSTTAAWIQIDSVDHSGAFVEPGFSGAGVWDATHRVVVGMVVAKRVSETAKIAYMIPACDLATEIPRLPIERRNLSSTFSPTWTILATVTFILVFAHFAVQRGAKNLEALSLGGDNAQLAAFWGMHVVAVLLPCLMWLFFRFSTAFRQHTWWQKVPALRLSLVPQPSPRPLSAIAAIVLFVVLPFAAQAHFISQFQDGKVFVQPLAFGCVTNELVDRGMICDRKDGLCWFDRPRLVSLVKTCDGSDAPYWNSAYRYGNNPAPGNWVTYYPVLQPLVIYLLTIVAWFFATSALLTALFEPKSDTQRLD